MRAYYQMHGKVFNANNFDKIIMKSVEKQINVKILYDVTLKP